MSKPKKVPKPPVSCTDGEIIAALEFSHGQLALAAQKLKMSTAGLSVRVARTPALKEARLDIIGDICYVAEANIHQAVLDGDVKTSQWVLERLATQKWGRPSRQEIETEAEPIGEAP